MVKIIFYLYEHHYGDSEPVFGALDTYIAGSWDDYTEHKLIPQDVVLKWASYRCVELDVPVGKHKYRYKRWNQLWSFMDFEAEYFIDETKPYKNNYNVIDVVETMHTNYLCTSCNNYNAEHKISISGVMHTPVTVTVCSICLPHMHAHEGRSLKLNLEKDDLEIDVEDDL